jgi:predicted NUDIX family phosphoesterase
VAEVLVVDRADFFGGDWPQGFVPLAGDAAAAFLDAAWRRGRFVDRPQAEQNPAWKQWIPYCVLRCGCREAAPAGGTAASGAAATGLFWVQRTSGQSEPRLHGSWSIGLGGHVEPIDGAAGDRQESGAECFLRSLERELAEELTLARPLPKPRFVGLLCDDLTPVGQVHAGLVYVCDLAADLAAARQAVGVREISKLRGGFGSLVEFRELWQDPARFESWSQFLIRAGLAGPTGGSSPGLATARAADPDGSAKTPTRRPSAPPAI